jgi:uncharacterized protein YjbI with pentapeptide repeats
MTLKNIILIDKRVQDYETIVSATDLDLCIPILFDYYTDTIDEIKARVFAVCQTDVMTTPVSDGPTYRCIGLLQHNYNRPFYNLVATNADLETPGSFISGVADSDPELATWSPLRDLITWCRTTPNIRGEYFDMMACALYSNPDWKYIIDTLEIQTGVTIRASTDNTGSATLGGNWFLESHTGVNLKTVYFTEAIEEYRGILYVYPYNIRQYSTKGFTTGEIITWGNSTGGGNSSSVNITSGVIAVYSTPNAFAALKSNGQVVTWGNTQNGGNSSSVSASISSDVVAVYSTGYAFAALKSNGQVITWGDSTYGGNSSSVSAGLSSGVIYVCSNYYASAALKSNGQVITWGDSTNGGDSSSVSASLSSGVVAIYPGQNAFAALKSNGQVITWGFSTYGGDSSTVSASLSSGVVSVYATNAAFAALKSNGQVITWGNSTYGGDSSSVSASLSSGVVAIYSTSGAFAAFKNNRQLITWGYSTYGGNSSSVSASLSSGVVAVYSNQSAFAALKSNGQVITWGDSANGGDSSSVSASLSSGVVVICPGSNSFAALKSNGQVITWGNSTYGGDSSTVSASLSSGVVSVYSNSLAYAALKSNGQVITWGYSTTGGSSSSVSASISSGIVVVYSSQQAFAALKTTATTFDLSMSYYSAMDRYNILSKKENRRRVDLTTLNNNVFTLSTAVDLQIFNPNIPTDKSLRIIVPTYVASSYSITSTATIPSGAGSVIIACDEGEWVTISGTTYVNYGTFVYQVDASNNFIKLTTTTIGGTPYNLYGGDGVNSSGIAMYIPLIPVVITNFPTSITKSNIIDISFALVDPSSNSPVAFTYSSSNTSVATIAGNVVTIVNIGTSTITVSQVANATYESGSSTMTLTVNPPNYNGLSIPNSDFTNKNLISATFVGTNLTGSIFTNATLTNVNFTNATIRGITTGGLIGTSTAILPSSDYYFKASGSAAGIAGNDTYIIGPYVRITGMDLSNVDISNIPTASFTGLITGGLTNTANAVLPSGYVFRNGFIVGNGVSLVSADLTGQTFANLSMRGVDLSGATLTSTTFTNTDLSGATIRNTNLSGLNFATATITNLASSGLNGGSGGSAVVLPSGYSIISGVLLGSSVNMSSVDLSGIVIPASQSCSSVNFSSANMTNADLSGVNLSNARFTGANLTNANFANTNLSGVTISSAQAVQLLSNPANATNQTIQNALSQLQKSELRANFPTILVDDLLDLSSNVTIFTPTVVSGTNQGTLTANPTVAFYMNLPVIAVGESYTLTINAQSIGTINNPSILTSYPSKTFIIARSLVGGVDTTTVTNTSTNTVVSNTISKIGNVVYKIHANQGLVTGIPYDMNVFKVVNVGIYDILSNNDYLDGQTGATGPRGVTGISGNVGATGPTGAGTVDGATGPQGPTGETGIVGVTGPQGLDGPTGVDGNTGMTGPEGPVGDAGTESGIGSSGPTGAVGATGPTGEQGVAGVIEYAGPTGLAGSTGPTGLSGSIAGMGATGPTGPTGAMNVGVWTVINAETPEPTTGYTNIQYSIPPLEEGQGDTRTTTRTTIGINASGVNNGTTALDIRYTMDISGTIKTVGMNSVSDYRIKHNIADLPFDRTVDNIHPVKYLNRLTGREEYGFLAHELQNVFPEMVVGAKDDTIGYQTIQYEQLFAIFIAEIKKLRDDVAEAEAAAE